MTAPGPTQASATHDADLLPEHDLDVAVVGLAVRVPGASSAGEFWARLVEGAESVTRLTRDELLANGVEPAVLDDPRYVPAASVLEGADGFDASLFGYSPREAVVTDPQIRLALEVAWEAFEDAGCDPRRHTGAIGVYAAASLNTYLLGNLHGQLNLTDFFLANDNLPAVVASGQDFLATRIGYKLGLRGPCLNVQCACSGSLVAVHLARQSLLSGECDVVLAGGASVYLPQRVGYIAREGLILSQDGHCRPFDAAATGTIFGRGVGFVVMKRLADAVSAGDRIYAVVKGSAVNNDGAGKVGFTAPSVDGQAAVIAEAMADAGVSPDSIGYIEAHGTGTAQGDPIEIAALTQAFRSRTDRRGFCAVGSVKGNIGHLDAASGIVSFIKTVLTVQHAELAPSINFSQPNPSIDFDGSPFYVNTTRRHWSPSPHGPRRAGVSAFGMGGTNAHVVLEEAPPAAQSDPSGRTHELLTLAGKDDAALAALAARYISTFEGPGAVPLADACFTTHVGRAALASRLAIVADAPATMAARLADAVAGRVAPGVVRSAGAGGQRPRIAWLFTGQGSAYAGMGQVLYESAPVFRDAFDRCEAALRPGLGLPLMEVMWGGATAKLADTAFAQPALFALQYALAALWRSWGVTPDAVLGHSVGEYAAACVAGILDLPTAARLVAERGRLMQSLPGSGAMAAVWASSADARPFLDGGVVIAADNGPASVVIAGEPAAVRAACSRFEASGVRTERLAVEHAFHSPQMEPMLAPFGQLASSIQRGIATTRWVSSVTGSWADRSAGTGEYWTRQIVQPVRFGPAVSTLLDAGFDAFVELGPTGTLTGLGRSATADPRVMWGASLRPHQEPWATLLETLGALWTRGAGVDWNGFDAAVPRRRVALPTYAFQHERFWQAATPRVAAPAGDANGGMEPRELQSPALARRVFEARVGRTAPGFLADHVVGGSAVFPLTGTLALLLKVAESLGPGLQIERLSLERAVSFVDDRTVTLQVVLGDSRGDEYPFELHCGSGTDGVSISWARFGAGVFARASAQSTPLPMSVPALKAQLKFASGESFYTALSAVGLQYGPSFRGIQDVWAGPGEVLARVAVPASIAQDASTQSFHPALADAYLQAVFAASAAFLQDDALFLPVAVERLVVSAPLGRGGWSHVEMQGVPAAGAAMATVRMLDADGRTCLELSGLRLQRRASVVRPETAPDPLDALLYRNDWQLADRHDAEPASVDAGLSETASAAFAAAASSEHLERYARLQPQLDALCASFVTAALRSLGWSEETGALVTTDALCGQLGVRPQFRRMFSRMLEMLAEDGWLVEAGDHWRVRGLPDPADPDEAARLLREFPEARAELTMTDRCGRALAAVLRGTQDALELLFPDGSLCDLEGLYRDSPFARAYNAIVCQAVQHVTNANPNARILEIGAGTGGTASSLIPAVAGHCAEYVFTDLSTAFLTRARQKFSAYPFVGFRLLNAERSPFEQGFEPGTYDVIVATNVLHATADLTSTVTSARQLLKPGGLLVAVEGIARQRWVDLIFGLTDGWWRFTDVERRGSYPLIDLAQWHALLLECGLEPVVSVPPASNVDGLFHQAVICARSPRVDATLDAGEDWLVFADAAGAGARVAEALRSRGARCTVVHAGASYDASVPGSVTVRAAEPSDFRRLLDFVRPGVSAPGHVAFLWGMTEVDEPATLAALHGAHRTALRGALHLVQALATSTHWRQASLSVVTHGVQAVVPGDQVRAAHAPLWGFARSAAFEHPELHCRRIDCDPSRDLDVEALVDELTCDGPDDEVAFRGGRRYVGRLVQATLSRTPGGVDRQHGNLRLSTGDGIGLDALRLRGEARREPAAGEVELRVDHAGLNFKDVLIASGHVDAPAAALGFECSGTVVRVGDGVTGLAVGEGVVAVTPGAFARHVTVDARVVLPRPRAFSSEVAASLPAAFLTAHYALVHVARIQAGDRVLIHAATGGVGQAAVQIAQRAGAIVFATAGSEEKRAWLRAAGVAHVMPSRDASFAATIDRLTDGRGVDIVLNSTTGDLLRASLASLGAQGRFVELGKAEVLSEAAFRSVRPLGSYAAIDVGEEFQRDPDRMRPMLAAVLGQVERGELAALPTETVSAREASGAFRTMAQARHIGKLVLDFTTIEGGESEGGLITPGCTYLVTGGTGGLGLLVARWLAERGATDLVLTGRSEPSTTALATVGQLRASGVNVVIQRGDIADPIEAARVLGDIAAGARPLGGIVHAAGIVDDGVILHQDWKRFASVMAAKVDGAWNLHSMTRDTPLAFFVMFSTLAALVGSAGQSNHAAANAFMDALAAERRAAGLRGLSINWGAWAEVGAAATAAMTSRLAQKGIRGIAPSAGIALLERVLQAEQAGQVVPSHLGVMDVSWPALLGDAAGRAARFSQVPLGPPAAAVSRPERSGAAETDDLSALLRVPESERRRELAAQLARHLAQTLALHSPEAVAHDRPFVDFGLDSLLAVELRSRVNKALHVSLPATIMFDFPTISALAEHLGCDVLRLAPWTHQEETASVAQGDILSSIESMSDDDVERALRARLTNRCDA